MNISGNQISLGLQLLMWLVFLITGFVFLSAFYIWQTALFISCFHNFLSIAIFYGNNMLVSYFVEKKQYWIYGLIFIAIATIATLIRIQVSHQVSLALPQSTPILSAEARILSFAILSTVPVLILSFFFQLLTNRYKTEKKYLSLINQHNEAQLHFLKAQINPHFLFNTLNNIYSLSVVKSEETPAMILLLSELLRYVIYDSRQEKVNVQSEILQIQNFIELFQMRQEHRQDISFVVKGNLEHWQIEPMILIPLVENCFKHCDFDSNESAFTRIELLAEDKCFVFSTFNTKNNHNRQKDGVGGVGLENIRKRLELQYENRYELMIDHQKTTFFVKLTLKAE
jgi:sensor histidine kinase YesM